MRCTRYALRQRQTFMPRATISTPQGSTSTSKSTPSLERLLRSHSLPKVHLWQGLTQGQRRRGQQARKLRSASSLAAPQQDSPQAAKPVQPNLSVSDCPPGYQIRSARAEEADQIAALNAEVNCTSCSWCTAAPDLSCSAPGAIWSFGAPKLI